MGKIYIDDNIINPNEWDSDKTMRWHTLIDLYLIADKTESNVVVKTTIRKLAERWDCSTKKVMSILDELEKKKLIKIASRDKSGTKIYLKNTNYIGVIGNTSGNTKGNTSGNAESIENTSIRATSGNNQGNTSGNTLGNIEITENRLVSIEKTKEVIYYPNDEKLNRAFIGYLNMRQKIGLNNLDSQVLSLQKRLESLSVRSNGVMDNDLAIDLLEQATVGQWKNIYSLKEEKKQGRNLMEEWRNA